MKINHYKALFTSVLGYFSTPVQRKQNQAIMKIKKNQGLDNLQKVKIDE